MKISPKFLVAAALAGAISARPALAAEADSSGHAAPPSAEKASCKAKDSCKGHDAKAEEAEKADKAACKGKDGCGGKEDAKDKEAAH